MNTINVWQSVSRKLNHVFPRAFIIAGFLLFAASGRTQTAPFLTVAPTGTNQLLITITNGVSTANYELWWTYKAIYRVGDAQVGQWSNPVSITVGG
jgi:hypothetical protein